MKRKNLHHYFNISSFDGTGLNDLFETVVKSSVKLHKENVIQLKCLYIIKTFFSPTTPTFYNCKNERVFCVAFQ